MSQNETEHEKVQACSNEENCKNGAKCHCIEPSESNEALNEHLYGSDVQDSQAEEEYKDYQQYVYEWVLACPDEDKATFPEHEQRLLFEEYPQVYKRLKDLENFLDNGDFHGVTFLNNRQKFLQTQQYAHMVGYVDVLSERISMILNPEAYETK